jgi:hypothetical protein
MGNWIPGVSGLSPGELADTANDTLSGVPVLGNEATGAALWTFTALAAPLTGGINLAAGEIASQTPLPDDPTYEQRKEQAGIVAALTVQEAGNALTPGLGDALAWLLLNWDIVLVALVVLWVVSQ